MAVERGHLVEGGADDGGGQVVGAQVLQGALAGAADGRAGGGDDDGLGHALTLRRADTASGEPGTVGTPQTVPASPLPERRRSVGVGESPHQLFQRGGDERPPTAGRP